MRFILKSAFWLGLIAFFLPFGGEPKATSANLTVFGAFIGAQQAVEDLTGFCDRAPQACDTGRELAIFAGERIGDGVAMAYSLVEDRVDPPAPVPVEGALAALPAAARTDPLTTGALAPLAGSAPLPAAYTPPVRRPAIDTPAPLAPVAARPAPDASIPPLPPIPTPAPRA